MLDEQTKELLMLLDKKCDNGSFKIFDISDLTAELPENVNAVTDTVKNAAIKLNERGLILLKYCDDVVLCLAVQSKGRQYVENIFKQPIETPIEKTVVEKEIVVYPQTKISLVVYVCAFVGAFVGSLLFSVVLWWFYVK